MTDNKYFLSYAMQAKSDRLIKLHHEIKKWNSYIKGINYLFVMMLLYVLLRIRHFGSYALSFINVNGGSINIIPIDKYFFVLAVISFAIFFYLLKLVAVINKKYHILRKGIIDSIGGGVCNCGQSCNCKDNYIRDMQESYGIDLIFD